MILSQPLVLAATLPHLINTFGAASVILSPILNILLFAAAVYLVFHIFNIAQQNNLFRNVFAAIGVLSMYNYIKDSLSRSTNTGPTYYPRTPYYPSDRDLGHSTIFNPSGASNRGHGHASIFTPSGASNRGHGHASISTPSGATNRGHGHS